MLVRFGLFSDLHYSPGAPGFNGRSLADLEQGLTKFAANQVDFAVSLGDNTQPQKTPREQYALLQLLSRKWNSYGFPVHAVFGNHEFSHMTLAQVLEIFQTDRTYYSFVLKDIRFVFLDTSWTPEGKHYDGDDCDWRFAGIPQEQVAWLDRTLADGKRTFIFTHNNLNEVSGREHGEWYRIANHSEVFDVIARYGCVEAIFQGHLHGSSSRMYRGVHIVNIPSPASEAYSDNSFPIIDILEEGFLYNGQRL